MTPVVVVVTDPTGAVIPHAEVKIASSPPLSAAPQKLNTNEGGRLSVDLESGEYDIMVHASGFRTVKRHIIAQSGILQSVGVVLQVDGCPPGCVVVQSVSASDHGLLLILSADPTPEPADSRAVLSENEGTETLLTWWPTCGYTGFTFDLQKTPKCLVQLGYRASG